MLSRERLRNAVVVVCILALILLILHRMMSMPTVELRVPLWDMAEYMFTGQSMAANLSDGNLIKAIRLLNSQVLHPPLFALLTIPFHLFVDDPHCAAIMLNHLLWLAVLLVTAYLGLQLGADDRTDSILLSIASVVFGIGSIICYTFANVVMTELLGTFWVTLTLVGSVRACRDRIHANRWHGIAGSAFSLAFLTKYSYGILAFPPVAMLLIYHLNRINKRRLHNPPSVPRMLVWIALSGFLMITCMIEARWNFPIDWSAMSRRAMANCAFGFVFTASLWLVQLVYKLWRTSTRNYGDEDRAFAWLLTTAGMPALLWLLIPVPNRFLTMFQFLINRHSELTVMGHVEFYPIILLNDFMSGRWTGVLLFLGLAVSISSLLFRLTGIRKKAIQASDIVLITLLIDGILLIYHGYKLDRNLVPLLPIIWCMGSLGLITLTNRLFSKTSKRITMILLVAFIIFNSPAFTTVPSDISSRYYAIDNARDVASEVIHWMRPECLNIVIGTNNHISIPLIQSEMLQAGMNAVSVQFELPRPESRSRRERCFSNEDESNRKFENWMQKSNAARLIAITVSPESIVMDDDFSRWNAWKQTYINLAGSDSRLNFSFGVSWERSRISVEVFDRHLFTCHFLNSDYCDEHD